MAADHPRRSSKRNRSGTSASKAFSGKAITCALTRLAIFIASLSAAVDVRRGTALALLLAAITHDLIGLILIVADATECEHRKW